VRASLRGGDGSVPIGGWRLFHVRIYGQNSLTRGEREGGELALSALRTMCVSKRSPLSPFIAPFVGVGPACEIHAHSLSSLIVSS
jgi:hypothetical protein